MSDGRPVSEGWRYYIRQEDAELVVEAGDPQGDDYHLTLSVGDKRVSACLRRETVDRLQEALMRLIKLDSPA